MLTFFLQILDYVANGRIYLFMILFLVVIVVWVSRLYLSREYRPWVSEFSGSVGVIVPVVDESPRVFSEVLDRVLSHNPDELVVVINGNRNVVLEDLCRIRDVRFLTTKIASKRAAIAMGIVEISSEIVVLLDSDTLWVEDTLGELLKPFSDARVGGVTSRQRVFEPRRSLLTRWANWLESLRFHYSMPAMSGVCPGFA